MRGPGELGYSLVELLIVIGLLALIAAVASPGFPSDDEAKLTRAASEVATALRFARSEALRTGQAHGLTVSHTSNDVTVRSYQITSFPVSALETVRHPITKQPYNFNVNEDKGTEGVEIAGSSPVFEYETVGHQDSLIFDENGTPIWMAGASGVAHRLADGTITLRYKDDVQSVGLSPTTGRVTIQ